MPGDRRRCRACDAELSRGRARHRRDPAVVGKARGPGAAECPGVECLLRCHAGRAAQVFGSAASENDRLVVAQPAVQDVGGAGGDAVARGAALRDELRNLAAAAGQAGLGRTPAGRRRSAGSRLRPVRRRSRTASAGSSSSTRDLGRALRQYDAATTVAQRQEALDRVYGALGALKQKNTAHPWVPSLTLQTALERPVQPAQPRHLGRRAPRWRRFSPTTSSRTGRSTTRATSRRSPPGRRPASGS